MRFEEGISAGDSGARLTLSNPTGAVRLRTDWPALLTVLPRIGEVRCTTATRHALLQVDGRYPEYQHFGCRGLFTADDFDLRLCLPMWTAALAVAHPERGGTLRRGIRFYSHAGEMIHEIALQGQSSLPVFESILEEFVDCDQSSMQVRAVQPESFRLASFFPIEAGAFLKDWARLKDTLSFAGLLRHYGITRRHAFLLAQNQFTQFVAPQKIRGLLDRIASRNLLLNLRVGNVACEQTFRGHIERIESMAGTLAIHSRKAHLQIEEKAVVAAWIVLIPTKAGPITSLELHSSDGQTIVTITGERTSTSRQDPAWSAVVTAT